MDGCLSWSNWSIHANLNYVMMHLLWYSGWLSVVYDTNGAVFNMITQGVIASTDYFPGPDTLVFLHQRLHMSSQGDSISYSSMEKSKGCKLRILSHLVLDCAVFTCNTSLYA